MFFRIFFIFPFHHRIICFGIVFQFQCVIEWNSGMKGGIHGKLKMINSNILGLEIWSTDYNCCCACCSIHYIIVDHVECCSFHPLLSIMSNCVNFVDSTYYYCRSCPTLVIPLIIIVDRSIIIIVDEIIMAKNIFWKEKDVNVVSRDWLVTSQIRFHFRKCDWEGSKLLSATAKQRAVTRTAAPARSLETVIL